MSANDAGWLMRHEAALAYPSYQERPLAQLVGIIGELSQRYATDQVCRVGVADLITGTRELLVGSFGDRLDMGRIDQHLGDCAARIQFCLDHERFEDECTTNREARS
jgi:hypothetical protein